MSTTELLPPDQWYPRQLTEFESTKAIIREASDRYLALTADLSDPGSVKSVVAAHKEVKSIRVEVEKRRKELKAPALEYGNRVDDIAKTLTALLEPMESHLKAERDRIDAEKARIREEKKRAAAALLQSRVEQLAAVRCPTGDLAALQSMSEDDFTAMLAAATKQFEAAQAEARERERLQAERQARQLEVSRRAYQLSQLGCSIPLDTIAEMTDEAYQSRLAAEQRRHQEELRKAEREAEEQRRREADAAAESERLRLELEAQREEIRRQQEEMNELREQQRRAEEQQRKETEEAARLQAEQDAVADSLIDEILAEEREGGPVETLGVKRVTATFNPEETDESLADTQRALESLASGIRSIVIPSQLSDQAPRLRVIINDAADRVANLPLN